MSESVVINRLDTSTADFDQRLAGLLAWEAVSDSQVNATVAQILSSVREQGDAALLQLTEKLDDEKRHIQSDCAVWTKRNYYHRN